MIKDLVSRCFTTRNFAHLEHWRASTHSTHVTLGEFYEDLVEELDALVEAYQGCFGIIQGLTAGCEPTSRDILKHLEEESDWIAENRHKIAEDVESLASLVDNISALYLTTIYKLRQFR